MCSDLGYHAAVPGIGVGTGEAGGPAPPPIFYLRDFINIHTCCADCHVAEYITFSPPPPPKWNCFLRLCQGFCHGQFMLMELFRFVFLFSQLFTINGFIPGQQFPPLYAFLPSKSRADYNWMFTILKEVQNLWIQLKINHYCLWIKLVTQLSKIAISGKDENPISAAFIS